MAGYSTTLRNARLDAITSTVGNGGKLAIYNGTKPATGGSATTKLAEFTLGSPFAPGASGGALSPTLPSSVTALADGTGTWARVTTSGGTFVMDLTAGTSGAEVILNTASIVTGGTCAVTAFAITAGNA